MSNDSDDSRSVISDGSYAAVLDSQVSALLDPSLDPLDSYSHTRDSTEGSSNAALLDNEDTSNAAVLDNQVSDTLEHSLEPLGSPIQTRRSAEGSSSTDIVGNQVSDSPGGSLDPLVSVIPTKGSLEGVTQRCRFYRPEAPQPLSTCCWGTKCSFIHSPQGREKRPNGISRKCRQLGVTKKQLQAMMALRTDAGSSSTQHSTPEAVTTLRMDAALSNTHHATSVVQPIPQGSVPPYTTPIAQTPSPQHPWWNYAASQWSHEDVGGYYTYHAQNFRPTTFPEAHDHGKYAW